MRTTRRATQYGALFFVLLLAFSADASQWKRWRCNGGYANGLFERDIACATPTSNSDDTEVISVGSCENVDFGLDADTNGDGTGATALTATLQWCPVPQDDATVNTNAERDAACVNYTGTGATLTGDGTLQGVGVPSGFVRANLGGTFAGDPTLWIRCNR